jgi:hypothetical protein
MNPWGPKRDRWVRVKNHPHARNRRNLDILYASALGENGADIARSYDISNNRVNLILHRHYELWRWRRDDRD